MFGPVLRGSKCVLRPPRKEELATYISWFADPDVIRYTFAVGPFSLSQEEDWFKKRAEDPDGVVWTIEVDGKAVGFTGIDGINWRYGNGETGTVIGVKALWRQGIASEAMAMRTRFAFHELGMHKLRTRVFMGNESSRRVLEKSGYRQSGVQREEAFRDGRWHDIWCGEVLREEWEKAQAT
jgi:RimJ/RimL family protein N-acetyltransferase